MNAVIDKARLLRGMREAMDAEEELKLLWEFVAEIGKESDADDFINDYLWRHA